MSGPIDSAALRTLLSQVGGDTQMQRRFVHDYVQLWHSRAKRLADALTAPFPNAEEAHVVLLSIRSSGAMVGAVAVESTAAVMHETLRGGDLVGALEYIPRLNEAGEQACEALSAQFALRLQP